MLQRSLGDALARFEHLQTLLMLLAAVSLGGLLAGSFFIARGITRSANQLAEGAARISQGDYSATFDVSSRDEIGALADAFNRMRTSIASHEQEILRLAYEDRLTGLPNRALFKDRLAGARVSPTQRDAARRAAAGPRPVQGDQRHARPPRRRRTAAGGRPAAAVGAAARRHGRAARRGRVRRRCCPRGDAARTPTSRERSCAASSSRSSATVVGSTSSASIGIARYPRSRRDVDTLIAQRRRRHVPGQGRDARASRSTTQAHDGTQQRASCRCSASSPRHRARRARLYFQPKIDLRTGERRRRRSARALAASRSADSSRRSSSSRFAEQTGLDAAADALGARRRRCAVRASGWRTAWTSTSPSTFRCATCTNADLPDMVAGLLASWRVPAERSMPRDHRERAVMADPQRASHSLAPLARAGRASCRSTTSAPATRRSPTCASLPRARDQDRPLVHRRDGATATTW